MSAGEIPEMDPKSGQMYIGLFSAEGDKYRQGQREDGRERAIKYDEEARESDKVLVT